MIFQKITLDKLGFVSRGRSRHRPRNAPELYGGPYPFVQTADVKRAGLWLTDYEQTYNEVGLAQSKMWPKGTLCITIAANIADTSILGIDACFPDSVIGFIADEKVCDARYIKYYFDCGFQQALQNFSRGAAQDNLSQDKLLSVPLDIPDVENQRRIASILSDYDSAIANARKQIELLEEAAMRLYREWFVDNADPKWVEGSVGDFAELLNGYAFKSKEFCSAGKYKIITIKNVKDGLFDVNKADAIDELPKSMPLHCKIQNGDILISLTGNVGRTCLTYGGGYLLNQRVAKIKSAFPSYAYCAFRSPTLQQIMLGLATGAAQQNLSPIKLCAAKWVIPDKIVLNNFEHRTRGMFSRIIVLLNTIQALTEARDRLLPKLMSGEIDVMKGSGK